MSKHQAGRLIIHLFLFSFLSFIFYDPLLPPPAPCHDARMKRGSNHEHAAIYLRGCTLPNLIAHSLSLSLSFSLFFLFFLFLLAFTHSRTWLTAEEKAIPALSGSTLRLPSSAFFSLLLRCVLSFVVSPYLLH